MLKESEKERETDEEEEGEREREQDRESDEEEEANIFLLSPDHSAASDKWSIDRGGR